VITNNHVLEEDQKTTIQTSDGVIHQATRIQINRQGKDLALIKFTSKNNYTVAPLTSATNLQANQLLYAAGYVGDDKYLTVVDGNLEAINKKPFVEGYQIGYTNEVQNGMSGGPIFTQQGQVIGINGLQPEPIFANPYVYEDGTTPTPVEKDTYSQYSWGILLTTAAAIAPQYIALNPDAVQPINSDIDLVARVREKARAITVKIQRLDENVHGSGVIVGYDPPTKTYYVLTSEHNFKQNTPNPFGVRIITGDGKQHSPQGEYQDFRTIFQNDLAIISFVSDKKYEVARIAQHKLKEDGGFVFAAGFPQSNPNELYLSAGTLFKEQEKTGEVQDTTQISRNSAGYGLVYTNWTEGGMSGGPVLDLRGNLVGIHGRVEGEYTPEDQSGDDRGNAYNYLQQYDKSLGDFAKAIELKPDYALAYYNRGNAYNYLQRYKEALGDYSKAIELKPDYALAYTGRGIAYSDLQQYDKAIGDYSKAIELNPDYALAHTGRGIAYPELQQYDKAIGDYNKAIELNPDYALAYTGRGIAYALTGEFQKALADAEKAAELYRQQGNEADYQDALRLISLIKEAMSK
jgi:tetratricopeptide (TPR) repeat protein